MWEEDGFILYESRAIMRHVARGSPLIPSEARASAIMEQWISVEYSYFYPEFTIYYQRVLKKAYQLGQPDEYVCKEGGALLPTLDLLEQHLAQSGSRYLSGRVHLADVTFAPYTFQFEACGLKSLLDERPALAAWSAVPSSGRHGATPRPAGS